MPGNRAITGGRITRHLHRVREGEGECKTYDFWHMKDATRFTRNFVDEGEPGKRQLYLPCQLNDSNNTTFWQKTALSPSWPTACAYVEVDMISN